MGDYILGLDSGGRKTIGRLVDKMKNVYAAFCVLKMHLEKVESLINVTLADTKLPLVVSGGLTKGNAIDGACILAERSLKAKVLNPK